MLITADLKYIYLTINRVNQAAVLELRSRCGRKAAATDALTAAEPPHFMKRKQIKGETSADCEDPAETRDQQSN